VIAAPPGLRRTRWLVLLLLAALVAVPVSAIAASPHDAARSHPPAEPFTAAPMRAFLPPGGVLLSVSCSRPMPRCMATGDQESRSGPLTLADMWLPGAWRRTASHRPARTLGALLSAVSCPKANVCMAVGRSYVTASRSVPLAEEWSGSAWRVLRVPHPAARGGFGSALTGVSCSSATRCLAVGANQTRSRTFALAISWNGRRWQTLRPRDVRHARASILLRVSCSGARACTAVGQSVGSDGTGTGLAERWNGGRWRIEQTAQVPAAPDLILSGVSCPTSTECIAAGYYGVSAYQPVAEAWNGASWRVLPTAALGTGVTAALGDVSCRSARSCLAVGYSKSGSYATLIEAWNGASWQIQPSPSRGTLSELYGVACLSARHCVAVGDYLNHAARRTALAESWNGTAWRIQRLPRF
jgi:hypothetical protein